MASEITVEALCAKSKLFGMLSKRGFVFKERFYMDDVYFTTLNPAKGDVDIWTLIDKSVIVRTVKLERRYFSSDGLATILHKKKHVVNGRVLSEEKIVCNLDNTAKAAKIFGAIGLKKWVTKKITGYVFLRENNELLVQDVQGLGLFIEIEQFENHRGTPNKILNELEKFVRDLKIPIGDDFHVNIAGRLYEKTKKDKAKKSRKK